jgi:3',5'-cyclic AMP phosphodiesterase CpdA
MMRTIVHISDLHFGAIDERLVEALAHAIAEIGPQLTAVSGDLTQRARRPQFRAARAFLERLPGPRIVVPGNHDVPLYNLLARFGNPLGGYRRFISAERYPIFTDAEILVAGADTTRAFTIAEGGLHARDVEHLAAVLRSAPDTSVRIVVCHHPFDPLTSGRARLTTPRPAADAVARLVAAGADVFLTGHLHLHYAGHTAVRYNVAGRSALVVEAGTATSIRGRGEPNSFNVLHVQRDAVTVERMDWDEAAARFRAARSESFTRSENGWFV